MTGSRILATLWSEWTDVVCRIASGTASSRVISETKYQTLYNNLLNACQEQAEGTPPAYARKLQSLVRPWFTLETLSKADDRILLDLMVKSQMIETRLTGKRRHHRGLLGQMRWPLVLLALALTSYFAWNSSEQLLHWDVFTTARAYTFKLARFLRGTSVMERMGVLALAVTTVGILLLKGMRKY